MIIFFVIALVVLSIPFIVLHEFLLWKDFKIHSVGGWLKIFLIGLGVVSICYLMIQIPLIYFSSTYPENIHYRDYLGGASLLGTIGGFRAMSIVRKYQPKT